MTDAADPPPSSQELQQSLQRALARPVPPVRVSLLYQVGLAIVSVAMLLLPTLYLGLIALVGYGMWFHATHNITILTIGPSLPALAAYVGPLFAGLVTAAFMVKPLFAPRSKRLEPQSLRREDHPLLFQCVDALCDAMGAPRPERIDADLQVNASAGFRRGIFSLLAGDLVLTVGLPLLSDLTVRQFIGVLAHEFGHFTQGTAMRLGYLINSVNGWFARVVYERDAWDEMLQETASASRSLLVTIIVGLSRLVVWLSRRLLSMLMWVGHGISCFLARQMEYNADGYQTKVAGSDAIESTHLRLGLLAVAMGKAEQNLSESWRERRLGDNLPALVALNARQFAEQPEVMQQISQAVLGTKTRLFDTHPATKDRVARANREAHPGIVLSDRPARELCNDFDDLCRSISLRFYQQAVDESITEANLVSTDTLLQQQLAMRAAALTLDRYTVGIPMIRLGIFPAFPGPDPAPSQSDALESLRAVRARLAERAPELHSAIGEFIPSDRRWKEARLGKRLAGAGTTFRLAARRFAGDRSIERGLDAARRHRDARYASIEDCVQAVRLRLESALQLVALDHREDEWAKGFARVESTLTALAGAWPRVEALADAVSELQFIAWSMSGKEGDETVNTHVSKLLSDMYSTMEEIFGALNELEYPYPHTSGRLSVAQYAMPSVPSSIHPDFFSAADVAVDNLFALYHRLMSDAAVLAERAEAAAGLPPIALSAQPHLDAASEPPPANDSSPEPPNES